MPYPVLVPESQLLFAAKLEEIRELYFDDRLRVAVGAVHVSEIDAELHEIVSEVGLSVLAQFGLRGEAFYALPCLLRAEPYLLGYYRLLYGISEKQFYKGAAFSKFRGMEQQGKIRTAVASELEGLCRALAGTGDILISTLSKLSFQAIHEMQLMTVGVAFDGLKRNEIGKSGVKQVVAVINQIIPPTAVISSSTTSIVFLNATGRKVTIAVTADPDINVVEQSENRVHQMLAIEVKAGRDASNRFNRLGEAEKSHHKAKLKGHTRFWTIVRVKYTPGEVHDNSPMTQEFWHLDEITDQHHPEHERFVSMFKSFLGLH